QLHAAIRLWFQGGDPIAIHTLALASHDIIHHIFRRKGLKGLFLDTERIRPEYRKKWAARMKVAANFFKHGRYADDRDLEFDPEINMYVLLASCHGLNRIGEAAAM